MTTIQTTPERIKAAAEYCPEARASLKILFPEAFTESKPMFAIGDCVKGQSGSIYIVTDAPVGSTCVDVTCLIAHGGVSRPGWRSTIVREGLERLPMPVL
ncbi:hypothetical protein LCGC14_0712900 [marine sediment metagenome]|uniref:Uncharacterized protein n=1 Tax=marine sediment metagenome TaxID=412755 RepID=A0A0F9QEK1_9ZZZZ